MISISAFKDYPELPELARRYGLGIEFTGLVEPLFYPAEFLERVRALPQFGLVNSAHGPFYDLMPASFDQEVRGLAAAKMHRAIAACRSLGIRHLVLHTGWFPKTLMDRPWLDNSLAFWRDILDGLGDGPDGGPAIYLENVYEDRPDLIRALLDSLDDPRLRACLDIGHVNANSSRSLDEWIDRLAPHIGHVHVHNNFGVDDEHNGLAAGTIDLAATLARLRADCPGATLNLEIRSDFEASIRTILDYAC